MTKYFRYIAIILFLAATSCSHKEIICPASENRQITVLFDWDHASGAAPEGMTLYFFRQEAGNRSGATTYPDPTVVLWNSPRAVIGW